MGFGVYIDKKADEAAENAKKKKAVGSEFYNTVAGIFGAGFMKTGATLYPCDVKTRDAYADVYKRQVYTMINYTDFRSGTIHQNM